MKNFLILLCSFFAFQLAAQNNTMCGNGDFESGVIDPAEWSGTYGNFANSGNCTPVPGVNSNTGFSSNLTIYSNDGNQTIVPVGTDPIISALSTVPPYPSTNNYSLRLGNSFCSFGSETISKTFNVSSGAKYLRFWYAYVGDFSHANGIPSAVTPVFSVTLYDNTASTDYSNLVNLGNGSNAMAASTADVFVTQFNNTWVYRNWTCVEVPLDSMANHNVTLTFINRDCTAGGHAGYAYIDNLCLDCYGSPSGSIELDTIQSDTCGLPGQICVNYTLPNAGSVTGDCQLDLTIYQNGVPLILFNSPLLTSGSQYCFPMNTTNLAALNNGLGGFDFSVTGHFTIPDNMGGTMVLPDKNIGSAPDGVIAGQNNDYEFICDGAFNCDSLIVTATDASDNRCCYRIDLQNHQNVPIAYVEATVNADWVFASGYTAGTPFAWWPGSPGSNSLPISILTPAGNSIPQGDYADALEFCLEPVVPGVTPLQVMAFTWYTAVPGVPGFRPVCSDTIVKNCKPDVVEPCVSYVGQVSCNPQNPYEYVINFQVTNNSNFTATHVSLDNLSNPLQFGFSACNASDHLSSIAIQLPLPLPPGGTSSTLCVKITSLYPVLTSTPLTFTVGLYNPTTCCHNETPVTITLQPCCDPCGDIAVSESPIDVPGGSQCCYSLDIVNDCAYQFFHKVETEIITPGIQFGYHAIGGPNASDWNMGGSTATSLIWVMNGNNYIPPGTTMDLIQFCIDGIDQASEVPQLIAIKWFTKDQFGRDSLACTDTLSLNCDPVVDYECLEVTNQVLECSPEDSVYCYTFTVENTSSIPFGATNLDLFELGGANIEFNGGGGTFPLPPLLPGDTIRLTVCFTAVPFPLPTGSELVFQYRLRYLMGDTCCYESDLDTIPVPSCDTICPPTCCCYPSNIRIPTGLSPNNDGLNDLFVIQGTERCQNVTLTVYNRWGNVVFKKDHYDNSWGGTNQNGEVLPQSTYFILLTLHDSGSSMSGFVDVRRQ